jgi:phosphate transport system substrate-binding protein
LLCSNFPDENITVVYRSDLSGSSLLWTDYLSKTNPDWKPTVGKGMTVAWPVGTGAEGNAGVA